MILIDYRQTLKKLLNHACKIGLALGYPELWGWPFSGGRLGTLFGPKSCVTSACLLLLQPGCLPASLSARLQACVSFSPSACLALFQPDCLPASLPVAKPLARAAIFVLFYAVANKSKPEPTKP